MDIQRVIKAYARFGEVLKYYVSSALDEISVNNVSSRHKFYAHVE